MKMTDLNQTKEVAIARGSFISGVLAGAAFGSFITFFIMISIVADVRNAYRSLRSEALSRGHIEYIHDKAGDPVLEWTGDDLESTTTRGESQSENALRN